MKASQGGSCGVRESDVLVSPPPVSVKSYQSFVGSRHLLKFWGKKPKSATGVALQEPLVMKCQKAKIDIYLYY